MKIARFVVYGLLLCLYSCGEDSNIARINEVIADAKSTFAPDKRTVYFDLNVEKQGDAYVIKGETSSLEAREAILKTLREENIPVQNRITTLPDSTVGNQPWAVVDVSVCNIRSQPKHSGELATQELMGTTLRVLSRINADWYYVQTPNNYLGYLDAGAIIRMNNTQIKQWEEKDKLVYLQPTGWIYNAPDKKSDIVTDVTAGAILVDLKNDKGGFREVALPNGRQGYVHAENLLVVNAGEGRELVNTAKRFLGVPYLWGGTSGKGFDCSGYTKTIYGLHGFLLPRDASQQVHVGELVDTDKTWKNLIPGDLLFFGNYREDGSERITHVAMYMGNGRIIHAAGRVKVESLNPEHADFSQHRYDSFIKAKRMLTNGVANAGVKPI